MVIGLRGESARLVLGFLRDGVHLGKIKSRLGWKTPLDSCRNLKIRQNACLFHADNVLRQSFIFQVLLEFILCHFWSKDLDLCGVTNVGDDLVVIFAEMLPETPVTDV